MGSKPNFAQDGQPVNFVSIQPIYVKKGGGGFQHVTVVNFNPDNRFWHPPEYHPGDIGGSTPTRLTRALGLDEGQSFESKGTDERDTASLAMLQRFIDESGSGQPPDIQVGTMVENVEAEPDDPQERREAVRLIEDIAGDITTPVQVSDQPVQVPRILIDGAEGAGRSSNTIKQAIKYIFGYLLSPFKRLRSPESYTSMDVDLDENTAMTISLILASALRFVDYDTRIKHDEHHIEDYELFIQQQREEEEKEKEQEQQHHAEQVAVGIRRSRSTREVVINEAKDRTYAISEVEGLIRTKGRSIFITMRLKQQEMSKVMGLLYDESVKLKAESATQHSFRIHNGGMKRHILRRGVKKNTRRERRGSIRSRCRSGRQQCRSSSSSSSSGKLKKNTQRCRSRNSKTRRKRKATRT